MLNGESKLLPCDIDDEVNFQWSDLSTNPHFVIGNEVSIDHAVLQQLTLTDRYFNYILTLHM